MINHRHKRRGFTLIEMILAIAITTIFIAIFVEIGQPVNEKMQRNVRELESYRQLLFVTAFLDDLAHISSISVSTTTSETAAITSIISPIASCGVSLIPEAGRGPIFACTFFHNGTTTIPLLNLLDYGTSTISISENVNGDSQYQLHIGKYILQFGMFPHLYVR